MKQTKAIKKSIETHTFIW